MPAARWGALLAAAAPSLGCSAASPPLVPEAPPAWTRSPTLRAHEEAVHKRTTTHREQYTLDPFHARFGDNEAFYSRITSRIEGKPPCPFEGPACGLLTLVIGGVEQPAQQAPHDWDALAGGRDAVYALRRDCIPNPTALYDFCSDPLRTTVIDRIDARGQITPYVEAALPPGTQRLWIVEPRGRPLLLFFSQWPDTSLDVAEVQPPSSPAAPARLGPLVPLPSVPAPRDAQDARRVEAQGRKALYGEPILTPLPADNAWAMVWVQAVPPPYGWPAGKPHRRAGAKHGCGGRSSRVLADVSVEKHVHVSRFEGTALRSDDIVLSSNDLNLAQQHLDVRLDGDQVRVSLASGAAD